MKVLAFAASSSTTSINKRLVTYATTLMASAEIEILDLNDYELPLFSEDKEKVLGKPKLAQDFLDSIAASDALIVSFAEHNGSYSAAYKNLFDWCSRINPKVFQNKPMVLLSTSPGARGGAGVLALAENSAPFFSGDVKASYSLPSFYENFDLEGSCVNNEDIKVLMQSAIDKLK
ncbi:NAD(P)H-dependent oxidoreductase [Neptunomonas sp.]|uniref:NADPH-dependent FMN reductase n=1 Tax=Neptunomonas sp. TaxID=1971898 RepID=UPI0025CB9D65|nr:NAD(P)H-dependent oxidoreductase [Neptunomonas sp.]